MSEHDAHNTLTATARMRALAEPVEDGKLMTFSERMYRAREARAMHEDMRGEGHARAMVNNPVYRAQEEARVQRNVDTDIDARMYAYLQSLNIEVATGAGLDALAGIKRPAGMTDEAVRNLNRLPDFRDGRCVHGNLDFTCHICAVEQGRVHEWGE